MLKFQADEHISTAVIVGLQRRGIDIISTADADLLGASDEEQLLRATETGRVLVTQDDDFLLLHSQAVSHAGIVFVQPRRPIGYIVRGLHFIHQMLSADEMQAHVEFL